MDWKNIFIGMLIGIFIGVAIIAMRNEDKQPIIQEVVVEKEDSKMCVNAARWVDCTAYTGHESETDKDPQITASMTKLRPGIIAVSRDLFDQGFVFGKKVYIHGIGIYTIADLMNKRFINRIDVFIGDKKQAKEFGIKQVKISLLEMDDERYKG